MNVYVNQERTKNLQNETEAMACNGAKLCEVAVFVSMQLHFCFAVDEYFVAER